MNGRNHRTQDFALLPGLIPNRGLSQPDLFMSGLRYTQQISSNGKALHFEDGVWLNVPPTTTRVVAASVARMASIPHGTTINAQGTATATAGPLPEIPPASVTPFSIGNPAGQIRMPEQDLTTPTQFRTPDPGAHGFDQATMDVVNTFLRSKAPENVTQVAVINVDSIASASVPGGGVANTAFLGPNAVTSQVRSTIWLCNINGAQTPSVMFYSQTVPLDFTGLSWPHITVGALTRTQS